MELMIRYHDTYDPAWGLLGYARPGDSGFDLRAAIPETTTLWPNERLLVMTGVSVAMPDGYELQVRPRSGLALQSGITVLNAPGTVDSCFRGELGVILVNHGDAPAEIKPGDRIAQGVLAAVARARFNAVLELPDSERGDGGFGSTGTG
jgi:dUTP pyrophosphatase